MVWLTLLGLGVGTLGTLVGAGGGFILMPVFFFLYPTESADQLTAISLAVVFFNALSGTTAYARAGKIHYRSGLVFAGASIPGAIVGAVMTSYLPRNIFDPIFAGILIVAAVYLFFRPISASQKPGNSLNSVNLKLGATLSVGVGFLSSFLGIGGGIIHVPALVHLLHYPIHIATATSHFVLAIVAGIGSIVHLYNGTLAPGFERVAWLAPGAVVGAQIGAHLSRKIKGRVVIRILALAIALVAIRLLVRPS